MDWDSMVKDKVFMTDLGEDRTVEVEGKQMTLGRYAVWAPIPRAGRHQVVEVGSDSDQLARKYNIPEELCLRVMSPGEAGQGGVAHG